MTKFLEGATTPFLLEMNPFLALLVIQIATKPSFVVIFSSLSDSSRVIEFVEYFFPLETDLFFHGGSKYTTSNLSSKTTFSTSARMNRAFPGTENKYVLSWRFLTKQYLSKKLLRF